MKILLALAIFFRLEFSVVGMEDEPIDLTLAASSFEIAREIDTASNGSQILLLRAKGATSVLSSITMPDGNTFLNAKQGIDAEFELIRSFGVDKPRLLLRTQYSMGVIESGKLSNKWMRRHILNTKPGVFLLAIANASETDLLKSSVILIVEAGLSEALQVILNEQLNEALALEWVKSGSSIKAARAILWTQRQTIWSASLFKHALLNANWKLESDWLVLAKLGLSFRIMNSISQSEWSTFLKAMPQSRRIFQELLFELENSNGQEIRSEIVDQIKTLLNNQVDPVLSVPAGGNGSTDK